MSISSSQIIPSPFSSPWQPYIYFISLWVYFCLVSNPLIAFLLDSIYEMSYDISTLSNLLHSLQQSQGPSMLLQMAIFYYF